MERKVDVDRGSQTSSTASSHGKVSEDPNRPMQPWEFVDGFQRLLGDDAEPDPIFFVESWTLGMPVAVERFMQRRKDQPGPRTEDVVSRDIENRGPGTPMREFVGRTELDSCPPTTILGDWGADCSQPYPEDIARARGPVSEDGDTVAAEGRGRYTTGPMTELDACQILGVTVVSSRRQIKAAYHRKVSQWHPDRLERGSEEMRLFATEQTAAINQAYNLLTSD